MNSPRLGLNTAAVLATCVVLSPAALADDPDIVYIRGTIRDFPQSHPDFNVSSATGHVAGNVALLGSRPMLSGDGFAVGTQWRNHSGQNIAPHMYYNGGTMQLGSYPVYNPSNALIDSWDSSEGEYGGDNVGPTPPMQVPGEMPVLTPPTDLPPHPSASGVNSNVHLPSGTHVIDFSFRCRDFSIDRDAIVIISGDQTIYATGSVSFGRDQTIEIPEGSSLAMYVGSGFDLAQGSMLNMNSPIQPERCSIYILGASSIIFNQQGKIAARVYAPNATMHLKQGDEFFGTFNGKELRLDQGSAFHWDGIPRSLCGSLIQDSFGQASGSSNGAVTSSESFNEWFTDVLGTNVSYMHTIPLVRNSSGVYEYLDNAFFPIDNMLLGNEGAAHNFNFTFTFAASFVHSGCADTFFEFHGADDAWVYINGQLAMDLGGVLPLVPQRIELDRIDLVEGERYQLHFYFAQRNPNHSVFRIRTNLVLESATPLSITALYD